MENILIRDNLELIYDNLEIFQYEFDSIPKEEWEKIKVNKDKCNTCLTTLVKELRSNKEKTNFIFSKILEKDVNVVFSGALEVPIVQDFNNMKELNNFIKELYYEGKIIKDIDVKPNGSAGYIAIIK